MNNIEIQQQNIASILPLSHKFAPGVYYREIFMPGISPEYPQGVFVVGAEHLTEHFNVVLTGHAKVLMDGVVHDIKAPCSFVSKAGVRKVLWVLEDMVWATIHPTTETDIATLERTLVKQPIQVLDEEVKCLLQS